jgi:uncharacterized membrane protein (UPF0127 family)
MGGFTITMFELPEEQAKGLQFMKPIPDRHLFVFTGITRGIVFHSRNVTEPIDIMFVSPGGEILERTVLVPPHETVMAPPGTAIAVEAKEGVLSGMAMEPGRTINLNALLGVPKINPFKEEAIEDEEEMKDEPVVDLKRNRIIMKGNSAKKAPLPPRRPVQLDEEEHAEPDEEPMKHEDPEDAEEHIDEDNGGMM